MYLRDFDSKTSILISEHNRLFWRGVWNQNIRNKKNWNVVRTMRQATHTYYVYVEHRQKQWQNNACHKIIQTHHFENTVAVFQVSHHSSLMKLEDDSIQMSGKYPVCGFFFLFIQTLDKNSMNFDTQFSPNVKLICVPFTIQYSIWFTLNVYLTFECWYKSTELNTNNRKMCSNALD